MAYTANHKGFDHFSCDDNERDAYHGGDTQNHTMDVMMIMTCMLFMMIPRISGWVAACITKTTGQITIYYNS